MLSSSTISWRAAVPALMDFIGTLGILLRAKRLGILPSARPLVEQLRRSGMYLDERLLQSVLVELGE